MPILIHHIISQGRARKPQLWKILTVKQQRATIEQRDQLDDAQIKFLENLVIQNEGLCMDSIQQGFYEDFGITPSYKTITQTLKQRKFWRKKFSDRAMGRYEDEWDKYWGEIVSKYSAEQLVFLSGTTVDGRMTYGWSGRRDRAGYEASFRPDRHLSVLPALSLNGLLTVKITHGSCDSASFSDFISDLLDEMNPFPEPNSVLILDNCPKHDRNTLREMVKSRGIRLIYYPPHSNPDMNPLQWFGIPAFKTWIREDLDELQSYFDSGDEENAIRFLQRGIEEIMTEEDAEAWYSACDYEIVD